MTDLVESDSLKMARGMVRWFRLLTIWSFVVVAWGVEMSILDWSWPRLIPIAVNVPIAVISYRQYRTFKRDVVMMRSIEESLHELANCYGNDSAFHHHAEQVEAGMAQMLRRLRR